MGGQVQNVVVETRLPSEPDMGALQLMQNPVVNVYKITKGDRGRENAQLVVNAATMSYQEVLKLQDTLPMGKIANSGPGVYRFSVIDQDGVSKTSWECRLGGGTLDNPLQGLPTLPTVPTGQPVQAGAAVPGWNAVAVSPTARPIGNGFFYDESLQLLTAPDGSLHSWRRGQPPPAILTASTPATSTTVTPVAQMPTFSTGMPELEATKAALANTQRALEELQRQQEVERREAAHRQEMSELREALKDLTTKLAERPGENAEVAELKRRFESQGQLDAIRAENKSTLDALMTMVREMGNNRGVDPMITMLTQLMGQQNTSAAEMLRAVREAGAEERRTFSAMLDRQALMAEKAAANNPLEKVGSLLDTLVERFGRILQIEREFSGGGGGFDWGSIIREALSRAGSAMQIYSQAKDNEARAMAARAQASIVHDRAQVALRGAKPAVAPGAPAGVSPIRQPRVKVQMPDLDKATIKELRAIFNSERDEIFFGDFYPHVQELRTAITSAPTEFPAKRIAGLLMQTREFIAELAKRGHVPHAAEIWAYNQLAYLIERLLPEFSEGLRSEVVKALAVLQQEEESAARVAANESPPVTPEPDEKAAEESEEEPETTPPAA